MIHPVVDVLAERSWFQAAISKPIIGALTAFSILGRRD